MSVQTFLSKFEEMNKTTQGHSYLNLVAKSGGGGGNKPTPYNVRSATRKTFEKWVDSTAVQHKAGLSLSDHTDSTLALDDDEGNEKCFRELLVRTNPPRLQSPIKTKKVINTISIQQQSTKKSQSSSFDEDSNLKGPVANRIKQAGAQTKKTKSSQSSSSNEDCIIKCPVRSERKQSNKEKSMSPTKKSARRVKVKKSVNHEVETTSIPQFQRDDEDTSSIATHHSTKGGSAVVTTRQQSSLISSQKVLDRTRNCGSPFQKASKSIKTLPREIDFSNSEDDDEDED